jgi:hypothetical protein
MPIGFPAYQEKSVRFRGRSRTELRHAADVALDELGWRSVKEGKWRYRASVPMGFFVVFLTWGARLTVEVDEEEMFIRSEGAIPIEWLDIGQHGENIKRFLDRVEDVLEDEH